MHGSILFPLKLTEVLLLFLIVVQSVPHLRLLSYIHLRGTLHVQILKKPQTKPQPQDYIHIWHKSVYLHYSRTIKQRIQDMHFIFIHHFNWLKGEEEEDQIDFPSFICFSFCLEIEVTITEV